jgi:hypothetical protein
LPSRGISFPNSIDAPEFVACRMWQFYDTGV